MCHGVNKSNKSERKALIADIASASFSCDLHTNMRDVKFVHLEKWDLYVKTFHPRNKKDVLCKLCDNKLAGL